MGPAGSRSAGPPDAGSPSVPAATAAPSVVPSPGHEVAASLLRSATLTSASSRAHTRSLSPAPLPKRAPRRSASTASGLRGSGALAESGLVTAWPPRAAHQSRLPSCAYPASLALSTPLQSARRHLLTPPGPLHPQPRLLRPPVPRSPRPIPMPIGTLSLTHTVSPRLLVAPRPPSPSRPSPLELVGVLATSVAVASEKPPSAPCGGIFNVLSPVLCAFSAGVASQAVGFVLGTCTLPRGVGGRGLFLRLWCRTWASSGAPDAGGGGADSSATLRTRRSPTRAFTIPENACAWWSSSWWPPCRRRAFTGAGLVALGRLLLVNGFGDCMWCHDEAHRTQHHHSHDERFSRSRRTLTTSRGFSLSDVHCGAASITAMRSGSALSTFARGLL